MRRKVGGWDAGEKAIDELFPCGKSGVEAKGLDERVEEALARLYYSEGGDQGIGEGFCSRPRCEPNSWLLTDEFYKAFRCGSANDRETCGSSLKQCVGKALMTRRQHKERCVGKVSRRCGNSAKKADCRVEREFPAESSQGGLLCA